MGGGGDLVWDCAAVELLMVGSSAMSNERIRAGAGEKISLFY